MIIEKNQELFFDKYALSSKRNIEEKDTFAYFYTMDEVIKGMRWIFDKASVLDYGCGIGQILDVYINENCGIKRSIVGIDLSENCIAIMREKYPYFKFRRIDDNRLYFLKNNEMESAYIIQVLHHTQDHEIIFKEIFRVLMPSGKLFIIDITCNNPFLELSRRIYVMLPNFIKKRYKGDLVVGETIPEKLQVDPEKTKKILDKCGFKIITFKSSHLFLFLFIWIQTILGFKEFRLWHIFLMKLQTIEDKMLKNSWFQKKAARFSIYAEKTQGG